MMKARLAVFWAVFAHVLTMWVLPPSSAQADPTKRNIVFILVDDMRYDAMSLAGHPFLKTPAIDALAKTGVHFRNAFVTTSLCSPSRASFLTGLYAHRHDVLNNATRLDPKIPTFPRLLQEAGYKTAFIGKWHMGGASDEPRPGFDYWASFRGQGRYFNNDFNINGQHKKIDEYVTDAITGLALDWVRENRDKPFLLYISHKAVHGPFTPPERYKNRFADVKIELPASMAHTPENYYRKPRWVLQQRQSWHGVDDMYFKRTSMLDFLQDYNRSMLAIDDSVDAVVKTLKELNLFEATLILFTSDNGFLHGEHGLIDKRCMYEESIRIPWIVSCPELYGTTGKTVDKMILNIDLAPTIVEAAGLEIPETMQGDSFLNLPNRPDMPWRTAFLYEYFWEPAFPETPTCLGIRTDRYKYIEYHGIWDTNELYDLQEDPREMRNRLSTSKRKKVAPDSGCKKIYQDLRRQLRKLVDEAGARPLPTWRK